MTHHDIPEDDHFNMSFGKKDADADYAKDILEQRLDSLGWKVTLMAIIIPCLIGIIVVIGYFSIRQQVTTFQDSGSATVKEISGTMEARVAEIKAAQTALAQKVDKALPAVEKNTQAIDKAARNINSLISTSKKTTQADDDMKKELSALSTETKRLASELAALSGRTKTLTEGIDGLKAELKRIDTEKAGRAELERVLSHNEQTYTQKLDAAVAKLEKRIQDLEKRIARITQPAPSAAPAPAQNTTPPRAPQVPRGLRKSLCRTDSNAVGAPDPAFDGRSVSSIFNQRPSKPSWLRCGGCLPEYPLPENRSG